MCNDPARRGARGMNNDLANLILSREIMAAAADCLQSGSPRPPNSSAERRQPSVA